MKKLVSLLLVLLLVFTGCSSGETKTQPTEETPPEVTSEAEPEESVEPESEPEGDYIVDYLGRKVALPETIDTIAALDPQIATFIIMFGGGERMVATTGGVQRNLLLQEISPNLADMSVPKTSGGVHFEEIARLDPDIMIIKRESFGDSLEKDMDQLGIPVIVVSTSSVQDQIDSIVMIEPLLKGEEIERAHNFIRFFEDTIDLALEKKEEIGDNKVRVFHSVNQAVRTSPFPSLPSDWLEMVGVENVAFTKEVEGVEGSYNATLEQIYLWDPDVIICNESGVNDYILEDEKWQGLSCVEKGKVYQMPIGLSRWGHHGSTEIPLAMLWTGVTLYPEQYAEIDLMEKTTEFYRDVVGWDLTPELYEQILSGHGIRTSGSQTFKPAV